MATQQSTAGAPGWRENRAARIAREVADRVARKQAKRGAPRAERPAEPEREPQKKEESTISAPHAARSFALPTMNSNKWTGAIIWLVGAYLTRQFLLQLGVAESFATPFGFVIQWVLTKAESPLWQGTGYPRLALFATLIDGGINAGGAWPFMKNLGGTDVWAMVNDVAGTPGAEPTLAAMLVCAVAVGLATAAAAEYFWNL